MKLILLPLNLSTWAQSLGSMWQKARIDSYLCLTAKIILAASCSCPKLSPLFLSPHSPPTFSLYFPLLQNPVWLSLQGSCASASWKTGLQRTCFPFSLQSIVSPESLISPTVHISCAPPICVALRWFIILLLINSLTVFFMFFIFLFYFHLYAQ